MVVPKFRAWDKIRNRISEVERIYIDTKGVRLRDENGEYWRRFDDVVLMQSTGLFDKNGKEIFESDIVEWEHVDTGQIVTGIVKYDTELGFWGMIDVRFNDLTSIGYLANQRVTVLGNIYDNPELVEG
ncbi:YopX family protein [Streptococcus suis]|uniref:YopX family protein n=1 Tax=Streptococcus suis TaxID=1307 RepID=UPI0037D7AD7B